LHFDWQTAVAVPVGNALFLRHIASDPSLQSQLPTLQLHTSSPRLRQQLLHYIVVGDVLGHSRILHQLLLDGNTNVMACEELLQFLESLKTSAVWVSNKNACGGMGKMFTQVQVG